MSAPSMERLVEPQSWVLLARGHPSVVRIVDGLTVGEDSTGQLRIATAGTTPAWLRFEVEDRALVLRLLSREFNLDGGDGIPGDSCRLTEPASLELPNNTLSISAAGKTAGKGEGRVIRLTRRYSINWLRPTPARGDGEAAPGRASEPTSKPAARGGLAADPGSAAKDRPAAAERSAKPLPAPPAPAVAEPPKVGKPDVRTPSRRAAGREETRTGQQRRQIRAKAAVQSPQRPVMAGKAATQPQRQVAPQPVEPRPNAAQPVAPEQPRRVRAKAAAAPQRQVTATVTAAQPRRQAEPQAGGPKSRAVRTSPRRTGRRLKAIRRPLSWPTTLATLAVYLASLGFSLLVETPVTDVRLSGESAIVGWSSLDVEGPSLLGEVERLLKMEQPPSRETLEFAVEAYRMAAQRYPEAGVAERLAVLEAELAGRVGR